MPRWKRFDFVAIILLSIYEFMKDDPLFWTDITNQCDQWSNIIDVKWKHQSISSSLRRAFTEQC